MTSVANKNSIQNKVFHFSTDSITYLKSRKGHFVTGYITTDEVDLYNEVVTEPAMDDMITKLKSGKIKLDIDHSQFDKKGDIPIGRIVEAKKIQEDGKIKIWVKAKLNDAHDKFGEVWKSVKDKMLDAFSIAYNIIDQTTESVNGKVVTLLKSLDIINVAITGNPVNRGASMTNSFKKAVKIGETQIEFKPSGSHTHTDEQVGDHTHEVYELILSSCTAKLEDALMRIKWLEQDIREMRDKVADGEKAVNETYKSQKKPGGKKSMTEENPAVPSNEDGKEKPADAPAEDKKEEAPATEEKPAEEPAPAEPNTDSAEGEKSVSDKIAEFKSVIDAQNKKIDSLQKQLDSPMLKSMAKMPEGNKSIDEENFSPLNMLG